MADKIDLEVKKDSGTVTWRGKKTIDGVDWASVVNLSPDCNEYDAARALEREFGRGHRWLVDRRQVKPLPEKVNVLINVFTYAKQIGSGAFTFCVGAGGQLQPMERVQNVSVSYCYGYPTDKQRNGAMKDARAHGHDFLLMIDDDQVPDCALGRREDMVPFLPTALEFALAHDGPCIVGAPYCGSPPLQEVMVMKNRAVVPDLQDGMGMKLDKFTRDEAARERGIKRVAALPTGCLLVDLRVMDVLPPPWFSYEFDDPPFNSKLASTEDIVFTRNLDWLGVPQYCHWSAWAGHDKQFVTDVPPEAPVTNIPQSIERALNCGWRPKEPRP